jgi:hypothetical protein
LRVEHKLKKVLSATASLISGKDPVTTLRIRRTDVVEDTINALSKLSSQQLKNPLQVEFVGEEGVDYGGLTQEFFTLSAKELLTDQKFRLFDYHPEGRFLWFSPEAAGGMEPQQKMDLYYLAGVLVGMSCFHGASVQLSFPTAVYAQLLGQPLTMSHLEQLEPELARSLQQLLSYEDEESFKDIFGDMTFEVNARGSELGEPGQPRTEGSGVESDAVTEHTAPMVELIPGGKKTHLTVHNRKQFVEQYLQYILVGSVSGASRSFSLGFRSVLGDTIMETLLTPQDLGELLRGTPTYDFKELERSARYEGGYSASHQTIKDFWGLVHTELTLEERKALLLFVTGSSAPPIGGLAEISMLIQRDGQDTERLPTAHTCFHTLLLPSYSSRDKLLRRLRVALHNADAGYGLQ